MSIFYMMFRIYKLNKNLIRFLAQLFSHVGSIVNNKFTYYDEIKFINTEF